MVNVKIEKIADEITLENAKLHYFKNETPLLLMISGGSDSTALAYVFAHLKKQEVIKNIAALHVNHKLRGGESENDAKFVEKLCNYLEIPLFLAEVDIKHLANFQSKNIEDVARYERYKCAEEALCSLCHHSSQKFENGKIVTAHTLDDRIETFYMRSIVGCGPGGFRSIKAINNNIIHPLLSYKKLELQEAINNMSNASKVLDKNDHAWRDDLTNFESDRFRTYIRNKLLPTIENYNRNYAQPLKRTMDLIAEEDDMLQEMAKEIAGEHFVIDEKQKIVRVNPSFARIKFPLQRRAVFLLLNELFSNNVRVSKDSVQAICDAFENDLPKSGYVENLQCDFVISSNKKGAIIEPVATYRARRGRLKP